MGVLSSIRRQWFQRTRSHVHVVPINNVYFDTLGKLSNGTISIIIKYDTWTIVRPFNCCYNVTLWFSIEANIEFGKNKWIMSQWQEPNLFTRNLSAACYSNFIIWCCRLYSAGPMVEGFWVIIKVLQPVNLLFSFSVWDLSFFSKQS